MLGFPWLTDCHDDYHACFACLWRLLTTDGLEDVEQGAGVDEAGKCPAPEVFAVCTDAVCTDVRDALMPYAPSPLGLRSLFPTLFFLWPREGDYPRKRRRGCCKLRRLLLHCTPRGRPAIVFITMPPPSPRLNSTRSKMCSLWTLFSLLRTMMQRCV